MKHQRIRPDQDERPLSPQGEQFLAEMFECIHGREVCDACVATARCVHKCIQCADRQNGREVR